jgi:hypothetical protein
MNNLIYFYIKKNLKLAKKINTELSEKLKLLMNSIKIKNSDLLLNLTQIKKKMKDQQNLIMPPLPPILKPN